MKVEDLVFLRCIRRWQESTRVILQTKAKLQWKLRRCRCWCPRALGRQLVKAAILYILVSFVNFLLAFAFALDRKRVDVALLYIPISFGNSQNYLVN